MGKLTSEREIQELIKKRPEHFLPPDRFNGNKSDKWTIILEEYDFGNKNIDFLLINKDATPIFVECKFHKNKEANGGIIGQMFNYLAHSKFRTAEIMHKHALLSYISDNILKKRLTNTFSPYSDPRIFFEKVEENIKSDNIILVLYLDKIPPQLAITIKQFHKILNNSKLQLLIFKLEFFEDDYKPIQYDGSNNFFPDLALSASNQRQINFYRKLEYSNNDFLFQSIAKCIEKTKISATARYNDYFRYKLNPLKYTFLLWAKDDQIFFEPEGEYLKSKIPAQYIENFSTWEKIEKILLKIIATCENRG